MAEASKEHLEKSKQSTNTKEMLHEMRKSIDALIQWAGKLKEEDSGYGREIAIAYTKLQEAKMWVGKCLEAIDAPLPEEFRDKAE